jgi:hypothetical protein
MTTPQKRPTTLNTDGIASNPLALLAGGVALGAVIGALIPRLARERELLDPVGRQLADRAAATVQAVKDTGRAEIDSILPPKDAAKERVGRLIENVLEAAKGAAAKA